MRKDPTVYIVFNSRDYNDLERAIQILEEKLEIEPAYLDPTSLQQEQIWESTTSYIERSRLVLLLVSGNFGKDEIDRKQYDFALKKARLIIPFTMGQPLSDGWQVFEFASQDCIDLLNTEQFEKFIRNMKSWIDAGSSQTGNTLDYPSIDMGLGVKWAKYNLGSRYEDLPGSYFAWGETNSRQWYGEKRQDYIWEAKAALTGYSMIEDNDKVTIQPAWIHTKYSSGELNSMEMVDDAASFILKGTWRIPSREDFRQLIDNCSIKWTEVPPGIPDGSKDSYVRSGYLFSSRINGNTLFFPLTGYQENFREECSLFQTDRFGGYWTSSLKGTSAYAMVLTPDEAKLATISDKSYGLNIRPVCL